MSKYLKSVHTHYILLGHFQCFSISNLVLASLGLLVNFLILCTLLVLIDVELEGPNNPFHAFLPAIVYSVVNRAAKYPHSRDYKQARAHQF